MPSYASVLTVTVSTCIVNLIISYAMTTRDSCVDSNCANRVTKMLSHEIEFTLCILKQTLK